jgi:hypothetical protein
MINSHGQIFVAQPSGKKIDSIVTIRVLSLESGSVRLFTIWIRRNCPFN